MLRAIAVVALGSGCSAPDEPRLIAIVPARVSAAEETPAVVTGANLRADLHLDLDSHAPATVDEDWAVLIADATMPATQWRDRTALDVTLPRGLPVGTHDLRAVAPDGTTLVLEAALSVVADDELVPDGPLDAMSELGADGPPDTAVDAAPDAAPDADETPLAPVIVEVNPFGDGTSFAFVTSYRGRAVVGPNQRGTALVTFAPDGSDHHDVAFHFERDVGGVNAMDNPSAPYRSIGSTGCVIDTPDCGPNNESMRGALAGVDIAGTSWLVMAGGHGARGLEYVYMSSDSDPDDLDFRYVDLKLSQNGDGYTTTALGVLSDRLYVGALGRGGSGPLLVALTTTPPLPGADPTPQEAISMQLASSSISAAGGTTEKVDALATFNSRLYIANPRGWLRSVSSTPSPFDPLTGGLHWVTISPLASAYTSTIDVKSPKLGDLYPADRAVPQMAAFAGRLYVARNTTTGPQLWVCRPSALAPKDCNAGNWRLVAASASSAQHTQLGDSLLSAITMVAATSTHLYVGFDSPTGVEVFRTASTGSPRAEDFVRLGPPGLGVPTATQIMDGKRLSLPGDDHVWLTIGSPSTPVTLVKLP